MIHNAFSKHYVPEIKLQANWKDTQLANMASKEREALILKDNARISIIIGKQADADKRGGMKRAKI